MTVNQYDKLCVGDTVTCVNGPNKNVPMKVTKKYLGGNNTRCLSAEGLMPNTVYNQRKEYRNSNWTWGSFHSFKIIKRDK